MMIAKNDEEKRSKAWRVVMISATIIIMLVAVFFITRLFVENPLKGTWKSEDNNMTLMFNDKSLTVTWDELFEADNVTVRMNYTLDKDVKTVTMKADEQSLKEAAEKSEGRFTEQGLEDSLEMLTMTFDYSLEQNELILTEREYGEQMVFTKE